VLCKTTIIHSEFQGRGELLPYYYYIKNRLFDTAVIIHDSVFMNSHLDLHVDKYQLIWEFEHYWDICEEELLMLNLFNDADLLDFYHKKNLWKGCFGGMSIITHDYLCSVNSRYDLSLLLGCVLNRNNRMSFERVIGCLLQKFSPQKSLLGNIHRYMTWGVSFAQKDDYRHLPVIKIWSTRKRI
jgi:hypothetical protein